MTILIPVFFDRPAVKRARDSVRPHGDLLIEFPYLGRRTTLRAVN